MPDDSDVKWNLKYYLTDHLAGAALAIRILKSLHSRYGDTEIGAFARDLLREIKADEQELRQLASLLEGSGGGWKRALARLFSGLGARKFVSQRPESFGAFEAFEMLGVGIQGKSALWRALIVIAEPQFTGTDFDGLLRRASSQHAAVEEMRIALAKQAFGSPTSERPFGDV